MISSPVLYVIVNKSLDMSAGKLAAQVGHAVAMVMAGARGATPADWMDSSHRWLIVLEAEDAQQLTNIRQYLTERQVESFGIIDEGVNEIPPFSLTAVGVEVLDKQSAQAAYLQDLPKYSDPAILARMGASLTEAKIENLERDLKYLENQPPVILWQRVVWRLSPGQRRHRLLTWYGRRVLDDRTGGKL